MRPLRVSIHALGGQGGGVLADWLVAVAEGQGWYAQATSVPGVAQRTGATIYYVELAPPGPEPVMALMPTPGDVDVVVASELMEAGRAIARGLVTPERTTLVASSHRLFAIGEKSAMGDGAFSAARVLEAAQASARRLVLADLQALAERHGSVISATLLGALAGSGSLPFARGAYEDAVRATGKGVVASLAAFGAGYAAAGAPPDLAGAVPRRPALPELPLSERVARLPAAARATAQLGVERLTDYQDQGYAGRYLDRLEAVAAAERALGGDGALTTAAAQHLALWLAYEDAVRVADLKTRGGRHARVTAEVRPGAAALMHTTEFMHPRLAELLDLAPPAWARFVEGRPGLRRRLDQWVDRDREVRTTSLGGFALLWGLARLRRFRPRSLRFGIEQERIDAWLASALNAARDDLALGLEVLKLQRLVRGYSDTHTRGLANFAAIMRALPGVQGLPDAAARVTALHRAALADDEGRALARALAIDAPAPALAMAAE